MGTLLRGGLVGTERKQRSSARGQRAPRLDGLDLLARKSPGLGISLAFHGVLFAALPLVVFSHKLIPREDSFDLAIHCEPPRVEPVASPVRLGFRDDETDGGPVLGDAGPLVLSRFGVGGSNVHSPSLLQASAVSSARVPAETVEDLLWLAELQSADGSWHSPYGDGSRPNAERTSLALIAFVSAGVMPWSDGPCRTLTGKSVRLGPSVKRGLHWLLANKPFSSARRLALAGFYDRGGPRMAHLAVEAFDDEAIARGRVWAASPWTVLAREIGHAHGLCAAPDPAHDELPAPLGAVLCGVIKSDAVSMRDVRALLRHDRDLFAERRVLVVASALGLIPRTESHVAWLRDEGAHPATGLDEQIHWTLARIASRE
jgi:hypothetical protein